MRSLILFVAAVLLVCSTTWAADPTATPSAADEQILFDDFNYTAADDPALSDNGWIVRTVDGWPGVPGAIWRAENVAFVDDLEIEGNRLMQMTSSADGDNTYQTQVCQARKFYEGTYA
ncbi:MAG: hydrolase, partial [Anaerolineae bacterium]|nr:hydrolase [Anaerolineae bacterium]